MCESTGTIDSELYSGLFELLDLELLPRGVVLSYMPNAGCGTLQ